MICLFFLVLFPFIMFLRMLQSLPSDAEFDHCCICLWRHPLYSCGSETNLRCTKKMQTEKQSPIYDCFMCLFSSLVQCLEPGCIEWLYCCLVFHSHVEPCTKVDTDSACACRWWAEYQKDMFPAARPSVVQTPVSWGRACGQCFLPPIKSFCISPSLGGPLFTPVSRAYLRLLSVTYLQATPVGFARTYP